MKCPRCLDLMAQVSFADIQVDRCPRCGAIFFDPAELDRLLNLRGSEEVDSGSPETGREWDRVPQIHCPRCLERGKRSLMITLADPDRPGLRFEHCPACGGSFLDAGEFVELKHMRFAEFLEELAGRP